MTEVMNVDLISAGKCEIIPGNNCSQNLCVRKYTDLVNDTQMDFWTEIYTGTSLQQN